MAQVVAKLGDGNIQTGWHGPAACSGTEFLDRIRRRPRPSRRAIARSRCWTRSRRRRARCRSSRANGCGGVLFHEAVGHPLEADAVDKEASVYRGLVGGAARASRSTASTTPRSRTAGAPTTSMTKASPWRARSCSRRASCRGSSRTGCARRRWAWRPPGNARRESYAYPPILRMTNTNILPGTTAPRTLSGHRARDLRDGARRRPGNPATGDFVFGVSEGFLIEHGADLDARARREPHRARDRGHGQRRAESRPVWKKNGTRNHSNHSGAMCRLNGVM